MFFTQANEQPGIERPAVVGQDPLDAYPHAAIVGHCMVRQAPDTVGALAWLLEART
jgi:hypothetical protein